MPKRLEVAVCRVVRRGLTEWVVSGELATYGLDVQPLLQKELQRQEHAWLDHGTAGGQCSWSGETTAESVKRWLRSLLVMIQHWRQIPPSPHTNVEE